MRWARTTGDHRVSERDGLADGIEDVALEAMQTAATMGHMYDLMISQAARIDHLEHETNFLRQALEERGINITRAPTVNEESAVPTPNTARSAHYPFDSPSQLVSVSGQRSRDGGGLLTPRPPTITRNPSGPLVQRSASRQHRIDGGLPTAPLPTSPIPPSDLAPPSTSNTAVGRSASSRSREQARSFRVNMEDPCWKVLPAALKKYKIYDDWKLYALFICFGNTGKCDTSTSAAR